jgi:hypothetical protein
MALIVDPSLYPLDEYNPLVNNIVPVVLFIISAPDNE